MAEDLHSREVALIASDRTRRQLLADISHELATPLAAIRGYAETLAMPDVGLDDPTRLRSLQVITDETDRLSRIVGDLLDLARLEGGGVPLERTAVSVAALFARVEHRHEPLLRERAIRLVTEVTPPNLTVLGDPGRLEQVLQNLAANAVRHTPDGGRIVVRGERAGDQVRLVVEDSGAGIPAQHLPHVFDRFYKADASRTGTPIPSGSGLGLSIVQAIVERHGGRVSATNGASGGARFEVLLPAQL
jgi:signal transduction histidine kinase